MLKAINYIFYGFFITMMLAIAGLLVASMLPIPGNIELKIVKSGSMEPTIPTGSLVIVKPSANYGVGDVITFGADTKTEIPTTHRIIEFETDENGRSVYRTKGDANEDADANAVSRGEVIGKVVFHVPYVGFVLDFARQPLGFALLIGVPAALVILEEVMTITKEVRMALRRRKKGKGGDEDADDELRGSGGTRLREVSRTERMVYLRKRAMDEIFVPMVVRTHGWMREQIPQRVDAYGSATLAVAAMVGVSTLLAGGAQNSIAYFNDIERSIGNLFAAASCDRFREGSCLPLKAAAIEEEPSALRVSADEESGETEEKTEEGAVLGEAVSAPETKPSEIPVEEPEELPDDPIELKDESAPADTKDEAMGDPEDVPASPPAEEIDAAPPAEEPPVETTPAPDTTPPTEPVT